MFSVLQIGHLLEFFFLSHSEHKHRWPQLQNNTLGGLVRHITHSSDLKDSEELIILASFCIYSSGSGFLIGNIDQY